MRNTATKPKLKVGRIRVATPSRSRNSEKSEEIREIREIKNESVHCVGSGPNVLNGSNLAMLCEAPRYSPTLQEELSEIYLTLKRVETHLIAARKTVCGKPEQLVCGILETHDLVSVARVIKNTVRNLEGLSVDIVSNLS